MTPEDPRHGTYAGFQIHKTAGEQACDDCLHAKYLYVKRMKMRLARGERNLVPIGDEAHRLLVVYPIRMVSELSGIGDPKLYGYREGGPQTQVNIRTRDAILNIPRTHLYTVIGIRRRIQALARLGHSAATIAADSGVNVKTIEWWRGTKPLPRWVRRPTAIAILETYDRMSMTVPAPSRSVTRARAAGEQNGWPPPLAWANVDDPNEQPTDWAYTAPDRATALRDLADMGAGITETCRRLRVGRESLQKWAGNNGMSDVYRKLAAREALDTNQYTGRGAA